jgi:hypothetical protein
MMGVFNDKLRHPSSLGRRSKQINVMLYGVLTTDYCLPNVNIGEKIWRYIRIFGLLLKSLEN